jgi:hypothetical protein
MAESRPPRRVATLGELRRGTPWFWLHCTGRGCAHRAPTALAPYIIRWGPDASSDLLRQSARCSRCGRKGATLQHPGWMGIEVGFELFPTGQGIFVES